MHWIVDAMNVIGCRPDGWWKNRRAAMAGLVDRVERWAAGHGHQVTVVFERPNSPPIRSSVIDVRHAPHAAANSADDEIVRLVQADPRPQEILVVTSDSTLIDRVRQAGASTRPATGFRDLIDNPTDDLTDDLTDRGRPEALRARFRQLHDHGCFVIPNPWDRGTAIALARLGFPALATTSAGLSFARGLPDSMTALSIEQTLDHIAEMVGAVDVPINADFQSGYAEGLDALAANVTRCVGTGVAGLSIEDSTGIADAALYPLPEAAERVRAARSAIDDAASDVLLTGRAECFLYGHPDPLAESIRRLQAYAEAGADVLFAPGVRERTDIASLVDALRPWPVNVLMASNIGLGVADLADLGVRRISTGSALSRVAWGAVLDAARSIVDAGTFAGLTGAAGFDELNELFSP